MRCLTLANALALKGGYCQFICRKDEGNLIELIKNNNFETMVLKSEDEFHVNYNNYWRKDVSETINYIKDKSIDWLIVDHYAIDSKWEKKIRPYVKKIMVIDDLANRVHDCDVILDQNFVKDFEVRYDKLIPIKCSRILGPYYALLGPEYTKLRLNILRKKDFIKRIFIYFGTDYQNKLTKLTLKALKNFELDNIYIDVVVHDQNTNTQEIEKWSKNNLFINIYKDVSSLGPLMLEADLAIGACGTTTWERCCLGLPTLVITIAENQRLIAQELNKYNIIYLLGHHNEIKVDTITRGLSSIFNQNKLKEWSLRCTNLVDGKGISSDSSRY